MNNMDSITKFEVLPNELVLECLKYFNALDIFHSFDCLKSRYNKLIRHKHTWLHLNTSYVTIPKLTKFYIKILSTPEIKNQIVSIELSVQYFYDYIKHLFSFFSLNEFPCLKKLTLVNLTAHHINQLLPILPSLYQLSHLVFSTSMQETHEIIPALPAQTIKTLLISDLNFDFSQMARLTSLVNVNIYSCAVEQLDAFLTYVPGLKYLNIITVYASFYPTFGQPHPTNEHAVCLKRLIINNFESEFDRLESIVKRISNLESLTISSGNSIGRSMMDAYRWEQLITSSLPLLKTFKFNFHAFVLINDNNDITDKLQEFENDFWLIQHHWYTQWEISSSDIRIYTIPYLSKQYSLQSYATRHCNASANNSNTFDKVTDLTLSSSVTTNEWEYYFTKIKSLCLYLFPWDNQHYDRLYKNSLQYLKTNFNLPNLIHLEISNICTMVSSSLLLGILKEASRLSSLKIGSNTLVSLFNDRELCDYMKKMIKKLYLDDNLGFVPNDFNKLSKICEIFSNLEEFRCNNLRLSINYVAMLDKLAKLPHLQRFLCNRYLVQVYENGWSVAQELPLDSYSFVLSS